MEEIPSKIYNNKYCSSYRLTESDCDTERRFKKACDDVMYSLIQACISDEQDTEIKEALIIILFNEDFVQDGKTPVHAHKEISERILFLHQWLIDNEFYEFVNPIKNIFPLYCDIFYQLNDKYNDDIYTWALADSLKNFFK